MCSILITKEEEQSSQNLSSTITSNFYFWKFNINNYPIYKIASVG